MSKLIIQKICKSIKKNEKDICVICNIETQYNKDFNINTRDYYIEGCGQLCQECYKNIYK
jgi:hypothetical protein